MLNDPSITLFAPALHLQDAFYRYCEAFQAANEPPRALEELAYRDFQAYLQKLKDRSLGVGLPPGHYPATVYWLMRGADTILGDCSLRHWLTPALERIGGHIGYAVHPQERGKGYGTLMLRLTLEKAKERGLERVLVTCDSDNIASARVILNNGGVLASEEQITPAGKLISRYWIDL